jgi:hypothetical protein
MQLIVIILPWLFGLLYTWMGVMSTYDIDFGILNMLFYFQIVTLFFESIITGSIFNNLWLLLTNPNSLLQILLAGLVQSSYLFINYVCVAGIGSIGMMNLRLVSLIKYIIIPDQDVINELWYNKYVPMNMIIFMLGIIYSCINPIICPIVLIYAVITLITEKYNHIYIYNKKHESGGNLWISIFNQTMIILYLFEFIMLFEFYSVYFKFICLLPLPFITLLYHYISNIMFNPLLESIPLYEAALLDHIEPELTEQEIENIKCSYECI